MDRLKLAKILALTASDKEGEAINAMRLANKMLEQANLTWSDVLTQQNTVSIRVFDFTPGRPAASAFDTGDMPDPHANAAVINQMFTTVFGFPQDGSDFWKWMEDIKGQWDKYQRLTPNQYDGLRRSYARAVKRRGARK